MPEIMLFTKAGCKDCDYIKKHLPEGVKVVFMDTDTATGMAEAAFYDVRTLPTLVFDDAVIIGVRNILDRLNATRAD